VQTRFLPTYASVPYIFNNEDFFPVEVTYKNQGLFIVGDFPRNGMAHNPTQVPISRQDTFYHLPQSLREIVGYPIFLADNGETLFKKLRQSNKSLFGASDASLKLNRATHAWILSSGDVQDISDPLLNISGSSAIFVF
jgi:hypothetical protein